MSRLDVGLPTTNLLLGLTEQLHVQEIAIVEATFFTRLIVILTGAVQV